MYHFSKFDPDNNFSDYYQFYDPIDNNFIDMVFNLLQNFEYQDAFIGDSEIHQNQIRNSKNAPAKKVESRPLPPDLTLITDCPIIAQPAMPPKNPATILAIP